MSTAEWLLRCLGHTAVLTLLLRAGAAKLAAPGPAAAALAELRPGRDTVSDGAVRVFAATEILVAFATVVPGLRVLACAAVAALGVGFAAAGLLGALRRSTVPCGCFGPRGGSPLGVPSMLLGLVFAAYGTGRLLLPAVGALPARTPAAVLFTALLCAAWLLTEHRAHARRALAAALDRTEATA